MEYKVNDQPVFDCAMCGHCCEGEGGIIISPKDLTRLAEYFCVSEKEFASNYAEIHNNKLRVKNSSDGFCLFFKVGAGCGVHEAKPDVCRAWPFFKGNIVDKESFSLARVDCKGINPNISHEAFAKAGIELLIEQGLIACDATVSGNALILDTVTVVHASCSDADFDSGAKE